MLLTILGSVGVLLAVIDWILGKNDKSLIKRIGILLVCIALAVIGYYNDSRDPLIMAELQFGKEEYEKSYKLYLLASKDNNDIAYTNLGYMFSMGLGVVQNKLLAKDYYEKAANLGNEQAIVNLGAWHVDNPYSSKELLAALKKAYPLDSENVNKFVAYCYAETMPSLNHPLRAEEIGSLSQKFFVELTDDEKINTIEDTAHYSYLGIHYSVILPHYSDFYVNIRSGDPVWIWDDSDSFAGSFQSPYKIYRKTYKYAHYLQEDFIYLRGK